MPPFEITYAEGPHTCVVRPIGDVDISVVPEIREGISGALEGGCENVVLDLTNVTYADSSALGLLVWLDHRLGPLRGRLLLAGANRDVTRILELSGLVRIASTIGMSANVTAALEGLELVPASADELSREYIDVPSDVNRLAEVRDEVADLMSGLGFPESAVFDMKVALGEALANALRHGAPSNGDNDVGVTAITFGDRLVLEVADRGPGFDGTPAQSGDVYATGGRGIMFMRALTDGVEFEPRPEGGTLVRLVKHRVGEAR